MHELSAFAPVETENLPLAHGVHLMLWATAHVPAWHFVHCEPDALAAPEEPDGQLDSPPAWHDVDPDKVRYGHTLHVPLPTLSQPVP